MRLNLAICDDESAEVEYLKMLVRKWGDEGGIDLCIQTFQSAENFLFIYAEDKSFDILLLDIQMKVLDGVKLAKIIRKENETIQIIFITGYPDFIADGYEVSALHYLIKPLSEAKLCGVLDRAQKNLIKLERSVLITVEGDHLRIPEGDILYCESIAHTTLIKAKEKIYEVRCSITEMEKILGDTFIRCHRSYIVSIRHIKRITKTDIILDNDIAIPLARRSYDEVYQAFIKYFRGVDHGIF